MLHAAGHDEFSIAAQAVSTVQCLPLAVYRGIKGAAPLPVILCTDHSNRMLQKPVGSNPHTAHAPEFLLGRI